MSEIAIIILAVGVGAASGLATVVIDPPVSLDRASRVNALATAWTIPYGPAR